MATRTLYGFDEDGNKIAVGSYDNSVTVTLIKSGHSSAEEYFSAITLTGGGSYETGDSVTIKCTSGTMHAYLEKWKDEQGNTISTANPYTFTVTEDTIIYAYIIAGGGN